MHIPTIIVPQRRSVDKVVLVQRTTALPGLALVLLSQVAGQHGADGEPEGGDGDHEGDEEHVGPISPLRVEVRVVRVNQEVWIVLFKLLVFEVSRWSVLEKRLREIMRLGEAKTKGRRGRVVILRSYGGDRLAPSGEVPRLWGKL